MHLRDILLTIALCQFSVPSFNLVEVSGKNLADLPSSSRTDTSRATSVSDVEELINLLGSDNFLTRREAESRLIALGAEAFDQLQAAQSNPDLEIATQAEYLLHRITGDYWVRPNDPEEVLELMRVYAKVTPRQRHEIIDQLAKLKEARGVCALSRISHFELSPSLAKYAALAIMESWDKHRDHVTKVASDIRQEIGESPRDTARWLQTYADQLESKEVISSRWLPLIDSESLLLNAEPEQTSSAIILKLMEFHIHLSADQQHPEILFESLRRRIDFVVAQGSHADDQPGILLRQMLAKTLLWAMKKQEWEALDKIESHYSEPMNQDRFLLYLMSITRAERGQDTEANQIADQAFSFVDPQKSDRTKIADTLAEYGRHDWAEKEWRYVIENSEVVSQESMDARRSLASWCLHDRGEDQAAADLLGEVCEAVDTDPLLKQSILQDNEQRYLLSDLRKSREFFLAFVKEKEGDIASQRKHLDLAYAHQMDMQDPDILIEMYHLPDQEEAYYAKVKERIRQAAQDVEQLIEKYPDEPHWYNHWAWLISNTEGDYAKAIRYSHRSLELAPDTPSYLDTLGRCYFSAGDLESAIKYQRRAVEKHPQVRVMRRQLKLFEDALAKSRTPTKGKP